MPDPVALNPNTQTPPAKKPDDKKKEYYPVKYDENHTAQMGSDNLFTGYNLVMNYGVDPLAEATGIVNSIPGRAMVVLTKEGVALYTGGVQHEVFGHGARNREAGCDPEHEFWPFPAQFGQMENFTCNKDLEQKVVATMGGSEANQEFSITIGQNMKIHGGNTSNAVLYLDTHFDTSNYIGIWDNPSLPDTSLSPFSEKEKSYPEFAPDISAYWEYMSRIEYEKLKQEHTVQEVHVQNLWNGPNFSYNNIRAGAVWNALDPYSWYLGYQAIKYIVTGKDGFNIPNFLPRTNFILGPNGPEYYLGLPFTISDVLIDPYIRTTANYDDNAFGAGVEARNIKLSLAKTEVLLDGNVHVWKNAQAFGISAGAGLYTNVIGNLWQPLDSLYLGTNMEVKTQGYVMSQPMEPGISWSAGLAYIPASRD